MKRLILAFFLAAAGLGFLAPRPAAAVSPVSPTVFREGGHPLRLTWTAKVHEAGSGTFMLYRRQVGREVHVATVPAHVGRQTYRVEDSGNLDASADYELRWRSASGEELIVGALRCERDSACNPWIPLPQRYTSLLESQATEDRSIRLTSHENLGEEAEARPLRGFVSTTHPPPRRGS